MKEWLKKLPLSTSGLMLGLAALGILLGPYHMGTRNLLGGSAGILLVLLVVKILSFPESLKGSFGNPVAESAMAAFPMSIMLLSTYVQPAMPTAAYTAWQLSIGLCVLLMVLNARTHLRQFSIEKMYPSLFVLFVGISAAGMTAPVYGMELLGQMLFWFGLIVYLPLLLLVTYRVLMIRNIPEPARPTLILYAFPAGLLLAGYLGSFPVKVNAVLIPLALCAFLMAVYGLVQMARLMVKLSFTPSFSVFTYPFVFSAIAFSSLIAYLTGTGSVSSWFVPARAFVVLGSTLLVLYAFFQYVFYMTTAEKKDVLPEKESLDLEEKPYGLENDATPSSRSHTAAGEAPYAFSQDHPVTGQEKESDKKEKAV
ncbi:MAG TPA: TDT family transporter [Clostridiaceae bacterium]|nr:TDT family transporter [Clostridiaceae bacterium]